MKIWKWGDKENWMTKVTYRKQPKDFIIKQYNKHMGIFRELILDEDEMREIADWLIDYQEMRGDIE